MESKFEKDLLAVGFNQKTVAEQNVYVYYSPLLNHRTDNAIVLLCYEKGGKVEMSSANDFECYEEFFGDDAEKICDRLHYQLEKPFAMKDFVLKMEVDTDENLYIEMDKFLREYLRVEDYFEAEIEDMM